MTSWSCTQRNEVTNRNQASIESGGNGGNYDGKTIEEKIISTIDKELLRYDMKVSDLDKIGAKLEPLIKKCFNRGSSNETEGLYKECFREANISCEKEFASKNLDNAKSIMVPCKFAVSRQICKSLPKLAECALNVTHVEDEKDDANLLETKLDTMKRLGISTEGYNEEKSKKFENEKKR